MTTSTKNHDRVREATSSSINEKIDDKTWQRVAGYAGKSEAEISARLEELSKEWNIERYLGVNMSSLAMGGLAAGALSKNKSWLFVPGVVLGFFFQHSVQGWCPPLPLFRKFNVRTGKEIAQERYALKMLRGDFDGLENESVQDIQKLKRAITKG